MRWATRDAGEVYRSGERGQRAREMLASRAAQGSSAGMGLCLWRACGMWVVGPRRSVAVTTTAHAMDA